MTRLIILGLVGLAAQLVDGALGMAYGATSATLLLTVGIAPAAASASVHMAEIGTTLASGTAHWKLGNVNWRTVGWIALPGAGGAFAGAVVLSSISAEAAAPLVAGFLFCLGLYILLRFARGVPRRSTGRPVPRLLLGPLGLFAGFMDAAGGGGWGPIATPTLLASGRMEPRRAIGSVDTAEFLVALGASAGFLLALERSALDLGIVLALLAGGLAAAPLAAWLVRRLPPRVLGSAVGGLILVTNLRTLSASVGLGGQELALAYAALVALWVAALGWAIADARRDRRLSLEAT